MSNLIATTSEPRFDSRTVEMKQAKQPRRKRSGSRGANRSIESAARARQSAWREGERPDLTRTISAELNGPEDRLPPEGLFAERRARRAKGPR